MFIRCEWVDLKWFFSLWWPMGAILKIFHKCNFNENRFKNHQNQLKIPRISSCIIMYQSSKLKGFTVVLRRPNSQVLSCTHASAGPNHMSKNLHLITLTRRQLDGLSLYVAAEQTLSVSNLQLCLIRRLKLEIYGRRFLLLWIMV